MSDRPRLAPALGLSSVPPPPPRPARKKITPPPTKNSDGAPAASDTKPEGEDQDTRDRDASLTSRTEIQPGSRRSRGAATPVADSTGGMRQTTLWLPLELEARLREIALEENLTQAEVVLNSIERAYDHLSDLVQDDLDDRGSGGGLFPDRPAARPQQGPAATVSLRTTAANLDVIDTVVTTTGARNRSHLVAVALSAADTVPTLSSRGLPEPAPSSVSEVGR